MRSESERGRLYQSCRLCPRACGIDRSRKRGRCGQTDEIKAARAALHMWEEPCISGTKGSGAVFFSGCSLSCRFCQNREISREGTGFPVSVCRLSEIFLELQGQGAANLNLVSAAHFLPSVLEALDLAREAGFHLPVLYNSSGYESVEALRLLEGYVDVYLPDLKYVSPELAGAFSGAADYPQRALAALEEMLRQQSSCSYDAGGYIQKGVIIRHLVLPGHTREAKAVLSLIAERFGTETTVSILSQFTPLFEDRCYPELNRALTKREIQKVWAYAIGLGFENGFFQEGLAAKDCFVPIFDGEGIRSKRDG